MLCLKALNRDDLWDEYVFLRDMPENENGVTNRLHGADFETFRDVAFPEMLANAAGERLRPGRVPETMLFLWKDETIIGHYRIRHYLNDALRAGAGHIACYIAPAYRGQGWGTKGLALTLDMARGIVPEDEIYLRVYKYNTPSLRAMLRCGGYIAGEDEEHCFVRVRR